MHILGIQILKSARPHGMYNYGFQSLLRQCVGIKRLGPRKIQVDIQAFDLIMRQIILE